MRSSLFILILVLSCFAEAKIKVGVLDSSFASANNVNHCDNVEASFNDSGRHSMHGIITATLIKEYAKDADYCVTGLVFYPSLDTSGAFLEALEYAANEEKFDILVIAAGGAYPNKFEKKVILKLLDVGVTIIAAAGNDGKDLGDVGDNTCTYYPACYDTRIVVVGASGVKESNKGKVVDDVQPGTYVYKRPGGLSAIKTRGSSIATAIFAGKVIYASHKLRQTLKKGKEYENGK